MDHLTINTFFSFRISEYFNWYSSLSCFVNPRSTINTILAHFFPKHFFLKEWKSERKRQKWENWEKKVRKLEGKRKKKGGKWMKNCWRKEVKIFDFELFTWRNHSLGLDAISSYVWPIIAISMFTKRIDTRII